MKIIQVTLETPNRMMMKVWYGINEIPQFSFENDESKPDLNCWLNFKRIDFPKTGTIGFSIRVHELIMQSSYSFQRQLEDLMKD